jgi:hypothetical protein
LVLFVSNTSYLAAFLILAAIFPLMFDIVDISYIHLYIFFIVIGMCLFICIKTSIMVDRLRKKYNIRGTKDKR